MIELEYEDDRDEEYESDVQKMQEWANSNGWRVEVNECENHVICLRRIDQ